MNPHARETAQNPPLQPNRHPVSRLLVPGFGTSKSAPAFGALLLVALVVYLWDFDAFQFGYSPDSTDYTLLAHALLKGPTYALHHSNAYPDTTQFPFGYPLLIVPFVLFAPGDFAFPAWLSLGATLLTGALLFWSWRTLAPGYSDRWRIAVTAMFLLAPTTVAQARHVLSDAVFTVFLLTAIILTTQLLATPRSLRLWFAFGICAFFMIFTRSIGWVPFACISLFFFVGFLREKPLRSAFARGAAVVLATFLVLVGAVLALTPVAPGNLLPITYLNWYGLMAPAVPAARPADGLTPAETPGEARDGGPDEIPRATSLNRIAIEEHIYQDLRRMLTLTGGGELEPTLALRFGAPWLTALPALCTLALLALGNARWWSETRRKWGITVFQATALVYLAISVPWAGGGDRLFYPIQPQLYFAMLLGIYTCWQLLLRVGVRFFPSLYRVQRAPFAVGGMTVLICGWLLLALYRDFTLPSSYRAWGDLTRRTEWVAANLPPDAVVMSDWPVRDYLVTGLETIEPTRNLDQTDQAVRFLRERGITHILLATDDSLQVKGIAPYNDRIQESRAVWQELMARGMLVVVHSDPFPVLVLRVVQ